MRYNCAEMDHRDRAMQEDAGASRSAAAEPDLKRGAISFLSNLVIGTASGGVRLLAGGDARVRRRDQGNRDLVAGRDDRRVRADDPDRDRLPAPQQRRPRPRHELRLGDARARTSSRLAQRVDDLHRRRRRDGVAGGHRRRLHVSAVRLVLRRQPHLDRDRRLGPVDRAHDLDLLARDRALGAPPAGAAELRADHAPHLLGRRLRQGRLEPPRGLDAVPDLVAEPVRRRLRADGRGGAPRGVHLLGLGQRRVGQRRDREQPLGAGRGGRDLDAAAARDLRRRLLGCAVLRGHEVPRRQPQ